MPYSDVAFEADTTTDWFADRLVEQQRAHRGDMLQEWAGRVLRGLPDGPVALVAMSVEGCALAAVVAAKRQHPTTWEQLALGRPQPVREGTVVVVEPIRLADGVLETLQRVLPAAAIVSGLAATPALAAA